MRSVLLAFVLLGTTALALALGLRAVASPTGSSIGSRCQDEDGDGYGLGCAKGPDCNDQNAQVHPGQPEVCGNLVDDDCNGLVDDVEGCPAPPIDRSLVTVPAGPFLMGSAPGEGSADEQPRHAVRLSRFRIDRHEVTNARYAACVKQRKCTKPALLSSHRRTEYFEDLRFADYPVVFVDWHQASTFCAWAGGRLPTEAEWEKTARGPSPSLHRFPWGDEMPDCRRANMGGKQSCVGDTDRVGRRPAGASFYGAHDMAGNVWEWVADRYDPHYYSGSPAMDPRGPAAGSLRVMRGGCWLSGADTLRVSCRKAELPSMWAYNVGFRCAYPAAQATERR